MGGCRFYRRGGRRLLPGLVGGRLEGIQAAAVVCCGPTRHFHPLSAGGDRRRSIAELALALGEFRAVAALTQEPGPEDGGDGPGSPASPTDRISLLSGRAHGCQACRRASGLDGLVAARRANLRT